MASVPVPLLLQVMVRSSIVKAQVVEHGVSVPIFCVAKHEESSTSVKVNITVAPSAGSVNVPPVLYGNVPNNIVPFKTLNAPEVPPFIAEASTVTV